MYVFNSEYSNLLLNHFLHIIVSCSTNFTKVEFEVFELIRDAALLIVLSNKHSICVFVDIKHNSV